MIHSSKSSESGKVNNLTIVVPCYNEEDALPIVLPQILRFCETHKFKLIIVNDGSTDSTSQILTDYSKHPLIRVVTHKVNRGYGAAIASGIRRTETEYVLTVDADGQHSLEEIPMLLNVMTTESADLVIGKRVYAISDNWFRKIGKSMIRFVAKILFPGMGLTDLNSGIKLYRTSIAKIFALYCPESMAFSDVIALMHLHFGMKVVETPVTISKRLAGRSKIRLQTAFETLLEILNLVILFKPMRIFIPVSLLLFLPGLLWGLRYIVMGRGLSVAALLLMMAGISAFSTGLLAEQGAQRIKAEIAERIETVLR